MALSGDHGTLRPAVIRQHVPITAEESDNVVGCPMTSDLSSMPGFRLLLQPSPGKGRRAGSEIMVEKPARAPRRRRREAVGQLEAEPLHACEQPSMPVSRFA